MKDDSNSFIYKSDTQGYDEAIIASIDKEFWSRVKCGVIELWRIGGKNYNKDAFLAMLDSFSFKVFEKNPGVNVHSSEVLSFLDHEDGVFDDLVFWRT